MSRFGVATRGEAVRGSEPVPLPDLRPARRRRWPWALLAVAVLAGVAVGMWELGRTTAPTPHAAPPPRLVGVLATSRPLAAGTRLAPSDLTVVRAVAGTKGSADWIPVSLEGSLLGRSVAAPLPAGALLTPGELTTRPFPSPGQALVGLELKGGEAPAAALAAGDRVEVVLVPAASQPPYPRAARITVATVSAVGAGGEPGTSDVELLVPAADAVSISSDAAHDEVALVLLG